MDDQVELLVAMYMMHDKNQMEYVNVNSVNEFE